MRGPWSPPARPTGPVTAYDADGGLIETFASAGG